MRPFPLCKRLPLRLGFCQFVERGCDLWPIFNWDAFRVKDGGLVRHNFRPGFLDKMIREAALMCMTPRLAEIRPLLSQFICPFHGYFLHSDKARPVRTTCSLSETSAPDTSLSLREIAGNLHRYGKRKSPKERRLGMVQNWLVLGNTDNRTPAAQ